MEGLRDVKHFQPCTRCSRQAPGEDLHQGKSEMNSSVEDLGVGSCSPWDDPARFIVVPAAYALALALGLPANVAALAVFVRSGRRLGQALRLYLLNLALADVLFTLTLPLWLTYYLGPAHWPFPEAACRAAGAAYYVSTYAAVAFAALISVCRCGSVRRPGPRATARSALRRRGPARAACAAAWLAGLACAAPSLAAPHALRPGPGGSARCLERGWARAGLAYATVAFFAAAFLLVLAAYVSLARALAAPSGPGPAPPARTGARPGPWSWGSCWSSPSAWRPTTCCWRRGWPGRRAPRAPTAAGAAPPPRSTSCTLSA
uniref:G-protein coupled receptors family 1 profile domain-containing protein n=1 Tax=Sus scrofa TaxID=9823 RepID=A0A4X1VZL6_PIG